MSEPDKKKSKKYDWDKDVELIDSIISGMKEKIVELKEMRNSIFHELEGYKDYKYIAEDMYDKFMDFY